MPAIDWPVEVDPVYGCWHWQGPTDDRGYPYKWLGGRLREWAHRHVWIAERGPIPDGLVLDHVCRVRDCVRPEHLEAVTQRENTRRIEWSYRAKRTTCGAGHSLFEHGRRTPYAGVIFRRCCGMK